nr:hypothetical protein [Candidatus Undinarchaeales archaeon ERR594346 U_76725]
VSTVNPGDPITFYSAAQNNGNFDATNLKFILFNCGAATPLDVSNFTCNSEFVPNGIDRLERPNRDKGIPGDIVEKELILLAPTSLPKATTGQDFGLRVMYDYSTTGTQEALLSSYDNWLQKGGQITGYVLNSYSSPAPISLEIVAPKTPIILQPNTTQTVSVAVNVKNSGGGSLEDNSFKEIRLKFDPAVLEPPSTIPPETEEEEQTQGQGQGQTQTQDSENDFEFLRDGDTLVITGQTDPMKLKIIGSTKQRWSYDIMFTVKSTASNIIQDATAFEASVEYTYMIDANARVSYAPSR